MVNIYTGTNKVISNGIGCRKYRRNWVLGAADVLYTTTRKRMNAKCSIELFNSVTSNMEFGTGFLFECILNEVSIVGIMTCNHVISDRTYLEKALFVFKRHEADEE